MKKYDIWLFPIVVRYPKNDFVGKKNCFILRIFDNFYIIILNMLNETLLPVPVPINDKFFKATKLFQIAVLSLAIISTVPGTVKLYCDDKFLTHSFRFFQTSLMRWF